MYELDLWDRCIYPWRYFITKIALPVEYNRFFFLLVDIMGNDATVNKIEKIQPFIIGIGRYIPDGATGLLKIFFKKCIVRFAGKINDAITATNGLGYLCMHFFRATDMIKRKKEVYPIRLLCGPEHGDQSPQQNKRENENCFDLSFEQQVFV